MFARLAAPVRLLVSLLCVLLVTGTVGAVTEQAAQAATKPTVTGVSPATGPTSGGTSVTVTGTGLIGATKVVFGKTAAANLVVTSDTSLTVTSPAAAKAGAVDVKVTTAGGTSAVSTADRFVYSTATVDHCGTIASNQTWASGLTHKVTCTVSVKKGVTLTIAPGAVVKFAAGTQLQVLGTLTVAGIATNPAYLTSLKDDTVAGDTALDGATTASTGDWNGVYASTATAGVGIDNAVIRYVSTAVEVDDGVISVTNSALNQAAGSGIYSESPANAPTLTGNTIADVAGYGIYLDSPAGGPTVAGNTVNRAISSAIEIDSANIDLAKLNDNNGSHNAIDGVTLDSDIQTVTSTVTLTGTLIPVLRGGCGYPLTVKTGITLTLGAGSLIKVYNCAGIEVDGTLATTGTAANPVTITNVYDDTIGGDTTGDRNATTPSTSDGYGINAPNAASALTLDHLTYRYSASGVHSANGTIAVTNSTIAHLNDVGIYAYNTAAAPVLTGNTVTDTNGDGIQVYAPTGVPTVTGNTVTQATSNAIEIDSANIDLAQLNNNNGSANATNGVVLITDVQNSTSTVTLTGTLIPVLVGGPGTLTVKAGVILTLGAGSVVKAYGASLQVDGRLATTGTPSNKVYLTSLRDDAVGGDTNNDGNATMPAVGDWQGIGLGSSGSTGLTNAVVRYNN